MSQTILTGVKPTGRPHLGNFVGAITPTLELARTTGGRVVVFIADGHALNAVRDPGGLRAHSLEVAATYLACGLDPARAVFFRQSDVPEVFELAAILGCVCPKGALNRAHAYKAAVAANVARGADPDAGINIGLYSYPVLMAADILAFDCDVVPVGPDQRQHVEIARELARRFNQTYGEALTVPELRVCVRQDVPGTDGRKMSKSYGNTIEPFASERALQRQVGAIRTSSRALGQPGDPDRSVVLAIHRAIASPQRAERARERLLAGAGDGELKKLLVDELRARFAGARDRYLELLANPTALDASLATGAVRARRIASGVLSRVKRACGLGDYAEPDDREDVDVPVRGAGG